MEIKFGNLKLTAKDGGDYPRDKTTIIIDTGVANPPFEVDSEELKTVIEALEKACWRP